MKKVNTTIQFLSLILLVMAVFITGFALASCKKEESIKSNEKDILTFTLSNQASIAQIDSENKKVTITVEYNTDLIKLSPSISVSEQATISPASGDTVDFSTSPVVYIVTAEDNSTQDWSVFVTEGPSTEKQILSFAIANQSGRTILDELNNSVSVVMPRETDLSGLSPEIIVSDQATIDPSSGASVDFSAGPVSYTVTAGDGTTKKWLVEVTTILFTGNDITNLTMPGQISSTRMNAFSYVVALPSETNFSSLAPTFELSPGATSSPASGEVVDFSQGPVAYIVTSESGKDKTWTVFASLELIGADDPNIEYVGRVDFGIPTEPKFTAPGVYITTKFTGTFCDIDIKGQNDMNYIKVVIDDNEPVRILVNSGISTYSIAADLPDGEHSVLICKETEASIGILTFHGFRAEGLAPITLPTRKIECYGNSISVGAKMLFGEPCDLTNDGTNWNAANSAYLAYGAVAARNLDAQWQISGISGVGLVNSCCDLGYTLPEVYDRIYLTDGSSPIWDFTKYIPDVVTICLGQNDGSTVVASEDYINTYVTFIDTLRSKYPNASIFCLTSPMADEALYNVMTTSLTTIVNQVNTAGDNAVYMVEMPYNQGNGCPGQGHPSEAEHLESAIALEAAIKAKLGW